MGVKAETTIVQKVMGYLTRNHHFDGFHVHGSPMQRKGEPDIDGSILLFPDEIQERWFHIKVEVKTPVGKPTELQLIRLREYHKRGYLVGIVTSVQDMHALIDVYKRWYGEYYFAYPITTIAKELGYEDVYNLWTK